MEPSEAYLAAERARWGQGSWRRESYRHEDEGQKERRSLEEQAQMERQRSVAEAKLQALRTARGEDVSAELPPSVARREGVAPLGARAEAEALRRQRTAEAAAHAAQEAETEARRDRLRSSLEEEALAKAAALRGSRGASDFISLLDAQPPPPPPLPVRPPLPERPPPSSPPPLPPRSRGGAADDMRRRREQQQSAERQRAAPDAAAAAAFRSELETETARLHAAFAASAASSASAAPPPQCNAPTLLSLTERSLTVTWGVGRAAEESADATCFQLQLLAPGWAEWRTLDASLRERQYTVAGLMAGTTYRLRVRSQAPGGAAWGGYSPPLSATTAGASAPGAAQAGFDSASLGPEWFAKLHTMHPGAQAAMGAHSPMAPAPPRGIAAAEALDWSTASAGERERALAGAL